MVTTILSALETALRQPAQGQSDDRGRAGLHGDRPLDTADARGAGVHGVRQGLLRPPLPRADPVADDGHGPGQLGDGGGREHRRGAHGRLRQAQAQPGRTADDRAGRDPGRRHPRRREAVPQAASGVRRDPDRPGQHPGLLRQLRDGLRRRRPGDHRGARARHPAASSDRPSPPGSGECARGVAADRRRHRGVEGADRGVRAPSGRAARPGRLARRPPDRGGVQPADLRRDLGRGDRDPGRGRRDAGRRPLAPEGRRPPARADRRARLSLRPPRRPRDGRRARLLPAQDQQARRAPRSSSGSGRSSRTRWSTRIS